MAYEQPGSLSPQERLAISRRALVNQLQGEVGAGEPDAGRRRRAPRASLLEGIAWAPMARSVVRHWWQRHPANTVGQLALPVLERYAREQPFKLVVAAATVGALVVLSRPWRLLPASAAVAALLKTSDVAGVVNTLMKRKPSPRKESR